MNEDLHRFRDNAANAHVDATASSRVKASTLAGRRARSSSAVRHRRRRRGPWALVILAALLVTSGVAGAIGYEMVNSRANQLQSQLTTHLQSGQGELEAGRTSLTTANSNHDDTLVTKANDHFVAARVQFAAARQLADSSRLLHSLEGLPAVGEQARSRHAAVNGVADMGMALSDAGVELAKLDGQLIKPASAGGQEGRTLLTVLNQTSTSLVAVRVDLVRAQDAAGQVDVRVLPANQQATFARAKATIGSAIGVADEFSRLVPVMTDLLGGNGVRTYLIEQVNPAELRPGGGFIGTYSVLQADHGTLKLNRSGNATELIGNRVPGKPGYVVPPGPIREFVPDTGWSFIDSNFFPDFPSNAKAGENFAQPLLATHIDAVISIDYYTVAKMLELTGPLAVPGYGITLNASNFVPVVVQYDLNAQFDPSAVPVHKAILAAVAGSLMNRVATLPPERWPALITALNELAASRHLQAYFNNDAVQKEIDQVGWSGTLNPTGAPEYVMEVESNLGGTKANYFVTRHFTFEITRDGSTLHHKVTIDLTDDMPFSYRPMEYYRAYLRLYVSDSAAYTATNLRPPQYPNPAPPAGTKMIDGWVPLFHGYGHSAQAVFTYDTPWRANGRGEDQIYWQKQPGTASDKVDVVWRDYSGHTYTTSGDLGQDRVIVFSSRGVRITNGQQAQAKLPSLSLG
jgi:hypothetical protein